MIEHYILSYQKTIANVKVETGDCLLSECLVFFFFNTELALAPESNDERTYFADLNLLMIFSKFRDVLERYTS